MNQAIQKSLPTWWYFIAAAPTVLLFILTWLIAPVHGEEMMSWQWLILKIWIALAIVCILIAAGRLARHITTRQQNVIFPTILFVLIIGGIHACIDIFLLALIVF